MRLLFLRRRRAGKIRGLCVKVAAQEEVQSDLVKQSLGWSGFDGFESCLRWRAELRLKQ